MNTVARHYIWHVAAHLCLCLPRHNRYPVL